MLEHNQIGDTTALTDLQVVEALGKGSSNLCHHPRVVMFEACSQLSAY
jgi:hypothetical protein